MSSPRAMRAKSIGHYILGKTIGEGTFGKVKLGTHILTGEKVAVKILEKERIVDVADVERVAREIHILKLVQHPHVIQLYEIIETPKQLYLIMEFCNGGELFDYIVASGRVREREACRFFHQIIAGVEQIHRMNVVHRDLKPENLLLDEQKNIKIVDFGLSNTFQDGQLLKTACGSPCYAAPEMIAGQRYVPSRCDIWSCGVILFALVCGYLPFEDQNTAALYRKILHAEYQAPKFISDSVRELIAKMLNTDPETRYTVPRIRAHGWFRQIPEASHSFEGDISERYLDDELLSQLDQFGFPREYGVKCLQMRKHNHVTTTYYLLLEKKRRRLKMQDAAGDAGRFEEMQISPRTVPPMELELPSERGGSPYQADGGPISARGGVPRVSLDPLAAVPQIAADADRAAGGSPSGHMVAGYAHPKTPDGRAHYGHWAQVSSPSPRGARAEAREQTPREVMPHFTQARPGAISAEPPSGTSTPHYSHLQGSYAPGSARGSTQRRHTSDQVTPRGAVGSSQTPSRRSPVPQAASAGVGTPRGPTPQTGGSSSFRSRTPGKRPPIGPLHSSEPLSARDSSHSRPGTSQGFAPQRPTGPPTSARTQAANEARRRHYTATPEAQAPHSARATAPLGVGSGAAATAAAVAADLYGSSPMPAPAWAASVSTSNAATLPPMSVSPDLAFEARLSGGATTPFGPAPGTMPLSARDEAMRTCRGSFNVSCTSSKAPKQIMQEMQRSLTLQRIAFKQATPFLLKCQKQSLRFEMEISHLDHLESIYVVRFRRSAGEMVAYKDLCARILAEMKI